jgi:outer membrane usher protein FimD/PapC
MSEQIDENVLECIKKSGYPLEMEISNKFDNDWKVDNTGYYYDYDENKGRDIDIVAAYKKSIWNHKQWNASYNVIVECKKKEDDAWIFFTRPHLSIDGCNQMTVDTMLLSRDDLGSACNAFVIVLNHIIIFVRILR